MNTFGGSMEAFDDNEEKEGDWEISMMKERKSYSSYYYSSTKFDNCKELWGSIFQKNKLFLVALVLAYIILSVVRGVLLEKQFERIQNYEVFVFQLNNVMTAFFFAILVFGRFVWKKFGDYNEGTAPEGSKQEIPQLSQQVLDNQKQARHDQEETIESTRLMYEKLRKPLRPSEEKLLIQSNAAKNSKDNLKINETTGDSGNLPPPSIPKVGSSDTPALSNREKNPNPADTASSIMEASSKTIWYWGIFFLVLAILSSSAYILQEAGLHTLGGHDTDKWINSMWLVLMNQGSIPIVIFFSFCFLSKQFLLVQIGAALLILGGAIIALLPYMLPNSTSERFSISGVEVVGPILLFAANIPWVLNQILKERALQSTTITFLTLGFTEIVFGIPINLLGSFPIFMLTDDDALAWTKNFSMASSCMSGYDMNKGDDCHNVWILVIGVSFWNFLWILGNFAILKYGSATLLFLLNAMCFPLENMILASTGLMGKYAIEWTMYNIYGILTMIMGLTIFGICQRSTRRRSYLLT